MSSNRRRNAPISPTRAAAAAAAACEALEPRRLLTVGAVDTTFNSTGHLTFDYAGGSDVVNGMVVQSDGKIVVGGKVGETPTAANGNVSSAAALFRYNSNGTLDSSFGSGGKVVHPLGANSSINAIALQSDGKIVVGGNESNEFIPATESFVARFNTNGSLDSTFGSGGVVLADPSALNHSLNALFVRADGEIFLAGQSDGHGWIESLNRNGFEDFGLVETRSTLTNFTAIQPWGTEEVLALSNGTVASYFAPALAPEEVFPPTYTLTGGKTLSKISSMVTDSSGDIYLAGFADGSLSAPAYVKLDFDEDLVDSGIRTGTAASFTNFIAVARDGTVDMAWPAALSQSTHTSLQSVGIQVSVGSHSVAAPVDFGTGPTTLTSIAVAPSGNVVVAGSHTDVAHGGQNFALARVVGVSTSSLAAISGQVYEDFNDDGKKNGGDTGSTEQNLLVYADLNFNGKWELNEPSTLTDAVGNYTLDGLFAGTYQIRLLTGESGFGEIVGTSSPASGGASVTVAAGQRASGINFGAENYADQGLISGTVFCDSNNNGKKDTGELGMNSWEIYLDLNNSGKADSGEPTAFTKFDGTYVFAGIKPGTYTIRQVLPANWKQALPSAGGAIHLTKTGVAAYANENFGDYSAVKYLRTVATTPGLVAWWTFDSTAGANSVVNGYAGSLEGGATLSTSAGAPIAGESGNQGLSLNGSAAFVNTNLRYQQQFQTAATFNVWINLGTTPPQIGHPYTILAKSQAGNDLDLQLESDGKIHFYTDSGSSTTFTPSSLTGWHMVTAEFDTQAKTRSIFWDGKLVIQTKPYNGSHTYSSSLFSIGESDLFTGRFFKGSIDEVSLWNRALTAAEVLAIFAASK